MLLPSLPPLLIPRPPLLGFGDSPGALVKKEEERGGGGGGTRRRRRRSLSAISPRGAEEEEEEEKHLGASLSRWTLSPILTGD